MSKSNLGGHLKSSSEFKLPSLPKHLTSEKRPRRRHSIEVSSLAASSHAFGLPQYWGAPNEEDEAETEGEHTDGSGELSDSSSSSPTHHRHQRSPKPPQQLRRRRSQQRPISSYPAPRHNSRQQHSPSQSPIVELAQIRRASLAVLPELDQHMGNKPRWRPEDATDEIIRQEAKDTSNVRVFQYLNLPAELIDENTIVEASRQRFESAAASRKVARPTTQASRSPPNPQATASLKEARNRRLGYGAWYRKANNWGKEPRNEDELFST
ncbi:hypothetical protein PTSG_08271, partial [Salpingoeca rosetta]